MRNFIKLIGIIALAALIAFSFAACGDDSGSNSGGGGRSGTLTITSIPSLVNLDTIFVYDGRNPVAYAPTAGVSGPSFRLYSTNTSTDFNRTGTFRIEITYNNPTGKKATTTHFSNGSTSLNWHTLADG